MRRSWHGGGALVVTAGEMTAPMRVHGGGARSATHVTNAAVPPAPMRVTINNTSQALP
ncbi:hypothetical protein [Corynebacterium sp. HS2168-gen11]|uniref:hypothetical protein n=1 Tax=Corynebacterium sp. HS2168-gen11 TaxID=2974027 RepID=UPI00216AD39D|nr:hypothetical protein [Corynebacterium sp. HS2168-gen11]MCS4535599.1 hypothetical protein [Corynebacterium sp. HS2168-gen11]